MATMIIPTISAKSLGDSRGWLFGLSFLLAGTILFTPLSIRDAGAAGEPDVVTFQATNVTANSAVLRGYTSQPMTGYATVWFEYGSSPNLTVATPKQLVSYPQSLGAHFSANLQNLSPGNLYYFRAAARNIIGTTYGDLLTFTTGGFPPAPPPGIMPFVATNSATGITQTSATLQAKVNPNGSFTSGWFEWGVTSSLGNTTSSQSMGSGNSGVLLSNFLTDLSPNTVYYFRAAAQNTFGTVFGKILAFTTPSQPSGGTPTVSTNNAASVGQNFATLHGSINPNGSFTTAWFEWGTSFSLGNETGFKSIGSTPGNFPFSISLQNLSPNTPYYFRAVAQNGFGTTRGSILSFTTQGNPPPPGSAPSVTTLNASSIGQTSAVLTASINPNGLSTLAGFDWGPTPSFGNLFSLQQIGSGNSHVTVTATLTGLAPNTTYYFRAFATNGVGVTDGGTVSFTTQTFGGGRSGTPEVTTSNATNVFSTGATMQGTVNPNGSFTTAWFEWGTSFSLGSETGFQSIGSTPGNFPFSISLQNLSPNTPYYFRAVAQNGFGTTRGSILSFSTFSGGGGGVGTLPTVSTFSPGSITQNSAVLQGTAVPNGSFTSAWFEWGPSSFLGNSTSRQSIGSGFSSTNYSTFISGLLPNSRYYVRAVAENAFGTSPGTIISFTTGGFAGGFPSGFGVPFVSTNGASFIETTSAQINSAVDPRGSPTVARFEWGQTPSLGNVTLNRDLGSGQGTVQFSWSLVGLFPNTTYYYRIIAQNTFGTSQGLITNFTTRPLFTPLPPPPSVRPPAPVIPPSLVLESSADPDEPAPGERIAYTLRYQNESDANSISRIALRITLPKNLDYRSSDIDPATRNGSTVNFNLGTLSPGESDELKIEFEVSENAEDGDTLAINAVATYRDAASREQAATNVFTLTVRDREFLAALFGLDIPLGWILLIVILILATIFFTRRFTQREPAAHLSLRRTSIGTSPTAQHLQ